MPFTVPLFLYLSHTVNLYIINLSLAIIAQNVIFLRKEEDGLGMPMAGRAASKADRAAPARGTALPAQEAAWPFIYLVELYSRRRGE